MDFSVGGKAALVRPELAVHHRDVDLGPAVGHCRVNNSGTSTASGQEVATPEVTVAKNWRHDRDQVVELGTDVLDASKVLRLQRGLDRWLVEVAQEPILPEELVAIERPSVVLW